MKIKKSRTTNKIEPYNKHYIRINLYFCIKL